MQLQHAHPTSRLIARRTLATTGNPSAGQVGWQELVDHTAQLLDPGRNRQPRCGAAAFAERLATLIRSDGYTLIAGRTNAAEGRTYLKARTIIIPSSLAATQRCAVLAHHAAHTRLDHHPDPVAVTCDGLPELAAVSVAYLTCTLAKVGARPRFGAQGAQLPHDTEGLLCEIIDCTRELLAGV